VSFLSLRFGGWRRWFRHHAFFALNKPFRCFAISFIMRKRLVSRYDPLVRIAGRMQSVNFPPVTDILLPDKSIIAVGTRLMSGRTTSFSLTLRYARLCGTPNRWHRSVAHQNTRIRVKNGVGNDVGLGLLSPWCEGHTVVDPSSLGDLVWLFVGFCAATRRIGAVLKTIIWKNAKVDGKGFVPKHVTRARLPSGLVEPAHAAGVFRMFCLVLVGSLKIGRWVKPAHGISCAAGSVFL